MSVNMELSAQENLEKLAPHKTFSSIFQPMKQIAGADRRIPSLSWKTARMERHHANRYLTGSIFDRPSLGDSLPGETPGDFSLQLAKEKAPFVPAGQSTQIIVGAPLRKAITSCCRLPESVPPFSI